MEANINCYTTWRIVLCEWIWVRNYPNPTRRWARLVLIPHSCLIPQGPAPHLALIMNKYTLTLTRPNTQSSTRWKRRQAVFSWVSKHTLSSFRIFHQDNFTNLVCLPTLTVVQMSRFFGFRSFKLTPTLPQDMGDCKGRKVTWWSLNWPRNMGLAPLPGVKLPYRRSNLLEIHLHRREHRRVSGQSLTCRPLYSSRTVHDKCITAQWHPSSMTQGQSLVHNSLYYLCYPFLFNFTTCISYWLYILSCISNSLLISMI